MRSASRTAVLLIIAGLILLSLGTILQFSGGSPKADPPLVQACRDDMKRRGGDANLVDRCGQTAFATATTATDAQAAARKIGAANNEEIGANSRAMLLIGLGVALVLGGLLVRRRTPSQRL